MTRLKNFIKINRILVTILLSLYTLPAFSGYSPHIFYSDIEETRYIYYMPYNMTGKEQESIMKSLAATLVSKAQKVKLIIGGASNNYNTNAIFSIYNWLNTIKNSLQLDLSSHLLGPVSIGKVLTFCAGDYRTASKHSYLSLSMPSMTLKGKANTLNAKMKEAKAMHKIVIDSLVACSNVTKEKMQIWLETGKTLTSEELKKYAFIDKISDQF